MRIILGYKAEHMLRFFFAVWQELDSSKFFIVMPLSPPVKRGNHKSPPFVKGDIGGFQQVIAKSPLTPLCERGEQEVAPLRKGGIGDIVVSISYKNFGLSRSYLILQKIRVIFLLAQVLLHQPS
jgi:hypothetical protein